MKVAVGLGLMEFPFAGAGDYWRWVDLCEAGGVDSLWQTDRLVSRQPILECMAVMAALAGRTRRMRFGMNVVSLALRDPVLLAKQCATVDVLSEGGAPGPDGLAPCVVHVVDRGIGIPRTEQARIFQRFYRVDPSRAKSVPGTGLGLAIVKHILILHGGSIRVESEPGKGSRFTVSLPATTPREAPALEETT